MSRAKVCFPCCLLTCLIVVGYNRGASREVLLDVYKSFGPTVKALLEMVDVSELNVWTLLDMDRIPSWVNGRLALMGDAAHPFLPRKFDTSKE